MKTIAAISLLALALCGCRREEVVTVPDNAAHGQGPPAREQRLRFLTTGLSRTSWTYSKLVARYDPVTGYTVIESFADSTVDGKFFMKFRGAGQGRFVYDVSSSTDTNNVYVRFTPVYLGGSPGSVFELTGNPVDQLRAEVSVGHFGSVGDSIAGTIASSLRLTSSTLNFKILLYDGAFSVTRVR